MTNVRGRIVVVGSSNTDMCVKTRRIPAPGETVIGGEFFMAPGGKGANQAVAAARAALPRSNARVDFVCRVGDDMFGRRALAGFRKDGVRTAWIRRDPQAASGIALILIDDEGENSIAVASGANAGLAPADVDRAARTISGADVLLMQLEIPLRTVKRAAQIAAERGVRVMLNPAPAQPLGEDLLKYVTILTPNEHEAGLLTGIRVKNGTTVEAAAEALLEKGPKTVIITLGAEGSLVASEGIKERVPGFKVKAVDTTAAGDAFNGALAVALSEGQPLLKSVRFASAAAAISVTRLGAQPSAPTRREIDSFLKSQK